MDEKANSDILNNYQGNRDGVMKKTPAVSDALQPRLHAEQLHTHYQQLPAMIIAPALGALFTAWVLWDAVNTSYLKIGLAGVLAISAVRVVLYRMYFARKREKVSRQIWRNLAISLALISGCIWGSTAVFLYPPLQAEYEVYMLVLLALVPVAPMAALAVYMPAFYAYYLPCIAPFVMTLGLQDGRAEKMTALLLLMMSGAIITFANKYSAMLTEAIRLRLQLADKTNQLEQAAIIKTRFLAAASHDLRQPVHAMGLFMASLQNQYQQLHDSPLFSQLGRALLNLRKMLDAMLDISRLDAGVVKLNQRDFRLSELLDALRDEYAPLAAQRGLELRYVASQQVVRSDPVLLERILRNLLINAIKYTKSKSSNPARILLGCRRRGKQIQIQICDCGSGIPSSQQDKIFHEFTRLHNSESHSEQSMGLGLSIVKRLADLLGHEISVHSAEDRGSIFSVTIPCSENMPESIHKKQTTNWISDPDLKHRQVLVVDDDQAIRLGMTALLAQWHADVIAAADIDELLKKISPLSRVPDLLIVDYRLAEGITALDVIEKLVSEFNQSIPVIIITGDTAPARIREAHDAGYTLLHKPVDPEKLKASISLLEPADQVAAL